MIFLNQLGILIPITTAKGDRQHHTSEVNVRQNEMDMVRYWQGCNLHFVPILAVAIKVLLRLIAAKINVRALHTLLLEENHRPKGWQGLGNTAPLYQPFQSFRNLVSRFLYSSHQAAISSARSKLFSSSWRRSGVVGLARVKFAGHA